MRSPNCIWLFFITISIDFFAAWDSLDAVVDVDGSVHGGGIECYDACIGEEDGLVQLLLQWEWILEVEGLAGNNGLECVVKPFPKGVDKASAIGADGAGAYWGFVDFHLQIEISKRVKSVLLGPIANVVGSIRREAQSTVLHPLVDLCVEVKRGIMRIGFRCFDIGCGVFEMFIQRLADVLFGVNANWP